MDFRILDSDVGGAEEVLHVLCRRSSKKCVCGVGSTSAPTQVELSHGDLADGDIHDPEPDTSEHEEDLYPHDLSNSTLTHHGLNQTKEVATFYRFLLKNI